MTSDKALEEAAKLSAAYVNGIAIGLAVVGGIVPILNTISVAQTVAAGPLRITALSMVCFVASGALHWRARRFLMRRLSQ